MNYLDQIQRGVDYIEANLEQPISISAVASGAGLSQWHFQRIFKGLTGDTVKDYIRSRRLGKALEQLLNSDKKIIDIAIEADFESQESFTRAFKSAFDTTPAEYRKAGKRRPFPQKVKFDQDYLEHISKRMNTVPEIYTQKEMHLVGLRTSFFGTDSEKNNIGEKLPPLWQQFIARLSEIKHTVRGTCYGVVRQIAENSDELEYFCAIEVTALTDIPDGMLAINIPACTYAKFTHNGAVNLIDNSINYIYSTWLPRSGRRHTNTTDLEFYGADYNPNSDASVMHYAIPIN
ncbi:helix-turn-helix domain-containing protein [Collimonas pratensis]|uniref:helix-turn-helix domain-containing protein n=1 Tax=Collimonas pratensis TaxID=279113 RepID=UPI00143D233C|nr:GyrI-like domain-containing protein [Collimonas pratensis]NKI68305.1 helix-turn-helix domain-containing protein [Collimonas pratensis]